MEGNRITISSHSENRFYTQVQGQLAHNTENGYRNLIFNHIVPHFKNAALPDLTEEIIQDFYKKLSNQGLSPRSVWCVHLLLRRILDEACCDGLLIENPAGINVPHEETQPAMRLRSGQIRRYLEATKELDVYPILYIGLTSGLRQGELISLPRAAFGMSEKRLRLQKTAQKDTIAPSSKTSTSYHLTPLCYEFIHYSTFPNHSLCISTT